MLNDSYSDNYQDDDYSDMNLPDISGTSNPSRTGTTYDQQQALSSPIIVPPLKFMPSTMEGSTGDVPIPPHYRDAQGGISPLLNPIDLGSHYINDNGDTVSPSGQVLIPAIKPSDGMDHIEDRLNKSISQKGSGFENLPIYQAKLSSELRDIAKRQGMDTYNDPKGVKWYNTNMQEGLKRASQYVQTVTPKDFVKLKDPFGGEVLVNTSTGQQIKPDMKIPGAPDENSSTMTPEERNAHIDAMHNQVVENPALGKLPAFAQNEKLYLQRGKDLSDKEKADAKQSEALGKQFNELIKQTPAQAGARSLLGTVVTSDNRANRALDILNKPIITKSELSMVVGDLAGIVQGGAPHESEMRNQGYDTLMGRLRGMQQFLTGKPTDAVSDDIKQRMVDLIGDMKKTNQAVINQHISSIEKTHPKAIQANQEAWDAFKETWGGGVNSGQESNNSSTPQKVLTSDVAARYFKMFKNKRDAMAAAAKDGYQE